MDAIRDGWVHEVDDEHRDGKSSQIGRRAEDIDPIASELTPRVALCHTHHLFLMPMTAYTSPVISNRAPVTPIAGLSFG